MDPISLTDFVDFVAKTGSPKQTKVKDVKGRGDYSPATDFYRGLRKGIVDFHESGSASKNDLDAVLKTLPDKRKLSHYTAGVRGYKKFLGKKKYTWLKPPKGVWDPGTLPIRVNPEVGLHFDAADHLIKLHFKKEGLTKKRTDMLLLLMELALGSQAKPGTKYAVLDVPNAKLFATDSPDHSLQPLLVGEAASFRAIWDQL